MKTTALVFALLFAAAMNAVASPIKDKDLAAVLDAHVKAIQARDLAALEETITAGEALDLILPNGKRMTTRKEYLDLHRAWFSTSNWTWTLEPVAVTAANDMAIVTARTRNEERGGETTAWSENWLTLAFRKENGQWRLVHDQNTRIATGP